jgi:MoxR-like ATPase
MADLLEIQNFAEKVKNNLKKVIIGKDQILDFIIIGLLCQGHILIEDIPGVGKTMLARSLAKSLGCSFKRLQFTPDMLPSDVTGVSIFNQLSREFEFRPGPIVSQVVLADEINRATPKTQSALLEAMEEKQITVDGITYPLPSPFLVMGTLNPIEYEGTFPLPEAQLDRFLLRVRLGYPALEDEIKILETQQLTHPIEDLIAVTAPEEVIRVQMGVRNVYAAKTIKKYIVDLTRLTRGSSEVYLGASPRGSLGLFRAGQARAAMQGRDFILPDDIKWVAEFVLSHRIVIDPAARLRDITAEMVINDALRVAIVPGGSFSNHSL